MRVNRLDAFERRAIAELARWAGLAGTIFETWGHLPAASVQSARSLIDHAQLGVTEERAIGELLIKASELGLLEQAHTGFQPKPSMHGLFPRLAFALGAIDYYKSSLHHDATTARIVLTKPARPSGLEERLSELGWRTSDMEPTEHAFHSMIRSAEHRAVVMTPFLDRRGAEWLRELFSLTKPNVERSLILRSLGDRSRKDYPDGYDTIAAWLRSEAIRVFDYSPARVEGMGRETFHAKVVLCDQNAAYVGSSNMTAASLDYSMEMGVTLCGRAAADVAVVLDAVMLVASPWQ